MDLSTVLSVLGFIVTLWVLQQTRDIKKSFTNKARLPEIQKELNKCASKINTLMKDWEGGKYLVSAEFSKCSGLIDNLLTKLDKDKSYQAQTLLDSLRHRPFPFIKVKSIHVEDEKKAWDLYAKLSELNAYLSQIVRDSQLGA